MAFIFGVDKTGFPLKISMRLETRDIMVFDDPLAITRAHVLSVPTDVYCPGAYLSFGIIVLHLKSSEVAASFSRYNCTTLKHSPMYNEKEHFMEQLHFRGPDIRSLFVDPGPAVALLKKMEAGKF